MSWSFHYPYREGTRDKAVDKTVRTRFKHLTGTIGTGENSENQKLNSDEMMYLKDEFVDIMLLNGMLSAGALALYDIMEERGILETLNTGQKKNSRIIADIMATKLKLDPNHPCIQKFLREWRQFFIAEKVHYRIGTSINDFDSIGHTSTDNDSCFAHGCDYRAAPAYLYYTQPSFVLWLSKTNSLAQKKAIPVDEMHGRCWGIVGNNGEIYITNMYYHKLHNARRLFVRAIEAALEEGVKRYKGVQVHAGVYSNDDGVCIVDGTKRTYTNYEFYTSNCFACQTYCGDIICSECDDRDRDYDYYDDDDWDYHEYDEEY